MGGGGLKKVLKAYKIQRCLGNQGGKDKHHRAREKESETTNSENNLTHTLTLHLTGPPKSPQPLVLLSRAKVQGENLWLDKSRSDYTTKGKG